jgi:CubicO group peptidase (beta-lactamase class C family)
MNPSTSADARTRAAAVLCLLLLFSAARAQAQQAAPQAGLPAEKVKQIEALVGAEMAKQKIPGLSVAVVSDRQVRWSAGFGMQDVENNVPARPATVYRLGSISKPITAVAVMQLFERGKLDLDAPVQKYCPAFPEKQWPVTTRQVLGHLAGIRHYKSDEEFNSTRFYASVADIIPNRAQGYRITDKGVLTNSPLADNSYKVPGGGFVSTAEDLARFAVALQTDKLLKRETLELMYAPQKTKDGKETAYGLGWGVSRRPTGERAVGHSGGQQRVSTFLGMQPDQGLAVVIMSNLEGARLGDLVQRIGDLVLK